MKFCLPLLMILCAAFVAQADRLEYPPLERLFDYYDARYDAEHNMLKVEFRSPGYHSRIESGAPVHPTRESLYYAIALLQRDEAGDAERAKQIVRAVLPLQETRTTVPEYGVWPWLLEEPLDQMDSVDLNWADFCGSAIAQILVDHADQLEPALRQEMKVALRHAANAIRKRDVQPGYTNIAILGAGVCAVAGELLDDRTLLEYGRQRLEKNRTAHCSDRRVHRIQQSAVRQSRNRRVRADPAIGQRRKRSQGGGNTSRQRMEDDRREFSSAHAAMGRSSQSNVNPLFEPDDGRVSKCQNWFRIGISN